MDAYEARFSTVLYARLIGMREDKLKLLARPKAADYAEYRERVGYIEGLAGAVAAIDEIQKEMAQGEIAEKVQRKTERYES